jgi:methylase of polypeptide subunit release factors
MKTQVNASALELLTCWKEFSANQVDAGEISLQSILAGSDPLSVYERFDTIQDGNYKISEDVIDAPIDLAESVASKTQQDFIDAGNPLNHSDVRKNKKELFIQKAYRYAIDYYAHILSSHFISGQIPKSGIALAFSEGCLHCYVIEYSIEYRRPEIHFAGRLAKPSGLMSIESISTLRGAHARNAAKRFFTSGHKVIIHRDVLTHVDRRYDNDVFGPTIDTLILADHACEVSNHQTVSRILEVGCGNGHILSCLTVASGANTPTAHYWDINPHSVLCTGRNLSANVQRHEIGQIASLGFVGAFDPSVVNQTYDLIVCNPPYIAEETDEEDRDTRRFGAAVSGVSLIYQMLNDCYDMLTACGRVLMMISSASLILDRIRSDERWLLAPLGPADGIKVPFDVEAVLIDQNRLDELIQSKGIFPNADQGYDHILFPIELSKKGEQQ